MVCSIKRFPTRFFVAAGLALAFAGCAAKQQRSAEEYRSTAAKAFRDGSYMYAAEQYRELLDQHPFSEHAQEAELRIAHAQYLNGSCPEAVSSLGDFQRRYPTSPHLAMVGYMIAQCYERQMRPPDRDQSASQNAHAYYQALIQQHPDSPFAQLAREQMHYCRENLARHELLVAQFYAGRSNHRATETRLLDLVNRFNDTDAAGEALVRLGTLYRDTGRPERAALAFAAATQHHAEHDAARQAQEQLAALGPDIKIEATDPLAELRAQSGRTRVLALAQTPEVPSLKDNRATTPGLAPGALPGSGAPFGGGGVGPFGGY